MNKKVTKQPKLKRKSKLKELRLLHSIKAPSGDLSWRFLVSHSGGFISWSPTYEKHEISIAENELGRQFTCLTTSEDGYIVTATSSGSIYVLTSGQNVALTTPRVRVTSLCIDPENESLYSFDVNGKIYRWHGVFKPNPNPSSQNISLNKDLNQVTSSCFYDRHLYVADSGVSLKQIDVSSGLVVKKWRECVTPPIKQILIEEGYIIYSSASNLVVMSPRKFEGDQIDHSLMLPKGMPVFIDFNRFTTDFLDVLAVSSLGEVFVWRHTATHLPQKPKFKTFVKTSNPQDPDLKILSAAFSSSTTILIVYGSILLPTFMTVAYTTAGGILPNVAIKMKKGNQIRQRRPLLPKVAPELQSRLHVIRIEDIKSLPTPGSDSTVTENSKTFAELLATNNLENTNASELPVLESKFLILKQALLSGDEELLTSVLQTSDKFVIRNTLAMLSEEELHLFLEKVSNRFLTTAKDGMALVDWMQELIISHGVKFMSNPNSAPRLTKLHAVVKSRLSCFPDLLNVSGRVNFILSVVDRNRVNKLKILKEEPLMVYDENDDMAIE